jgi:arginine repressor
VAGDDTILVVVRRTEQRGAVLEAFRQLLE